MNCSPTLSAEDFKNVHNGKCELHGILQSLEGVVHPNVTARLKKAIELINLGLESAYEQDDAAYKKASDHINEVEQELGGMKSIWSMYEIKDLRARHPWADGTIVTYQGWGDVEVKVRIDGPLWTDVWRAADKAIRQSGDNHHIFIEGFTQSQNPAEIVLSTGS